MREAFQISPANGLRAFKIGQSSRALTRRLPEHQFLSLAEIGRMQRACVTDQDDLKIGSSVAVQIAKDRRVFIRCSGKIEVEAVAAGTADQTSALADLKLVVSSLPNKRVIPSKDQDSGPIVTEELEAA